MKKLLILLIAILHVSLLQAQETVADKVEMADTLRQNGKIYVVVVVVAIIFTGFLIYLFIVDGKIKKLEKEIKEKK